MGITLSTLFTSIECIAKIMSHTKMLLIVRYPTKH